MGDCLYPEELSSPGSSVRPWSLQVDKLQRIVYLCIRMPPRVQLPCWPPGAVYMRSECSGQEGSVWVDTQTHACHFPGSSIGSVQRKCIPVRSIPKDGEENVSDHACAAAHLFLCRLPCQRQSDTPNRRIPSPFKES